MSTDPKKNRNIVMVVGPLEYEQAVLGVLGEPSIPQGAPEFIEQMGSALDNLTRVLGSTPHTSQPFLISGSGSLGWDLITANLLESGDEVLVLHTGYFSDAFTECLDAYDMKVHQVVAVTGDTVNYNEVSDMLKGHPQIKMITFAHVDTSTGVRNDVQTLSSLARSINPDILVAVDGVCSFGAELFLFDEWGIDAAMGCSQKALGTPPGLTTLLLSPRSISYIESRTSRIPTYYSSLKRWLPIMRSYQARKGSYFATPNVNLVRAFNLSLQMMLSYGMLERYADHEAHSLAVKKAFDALQLVQVPLRPSIACHTLTSAYYPAGLDGNRVLQIAADNGVWLATGLHRAIGSKHLRLGHMSVSVSPYPHSQRYEKHPNHHVDINKANGTTNNVDDDNDDNDVSLAIAALEAALRECGYIFESGIGVKTYKQEIKKYRDSKIKTNK